MNIPTNCSIARFVPVMIDGDHEAKAQSLLLNSGPNVQECDTTNDHSSTKAG
ncbi:hypothetical protein [Terrimonas alba]|uniref:hypothetical protein n=1 Tax=Terrimonas alba TaxID=3349636 RepID=UPI0035F3BA28